MEQMTIKILVSDPISEQGIDLLKDKKNYQVDVKLKLSEDELIKIIGDYNGLIVRSETKVTPNIINAAKNLKIIGRAGVGIDNVDVPSASKKGIIVMNTPGGNTISAAEHTVSMMLALSRNIPQANASLKNKKWDRKLFTGTEVFGKVLGIIGLGKIGAEVAKRAKAFGMEILGYDPVASSEHAEKIGAKLVSLDEIIKNSDYITLHVPKTKETENLINKTTISKMKDGVRIINVARGGIINEQDLADAVKSGKVKGAAIDVFSTEPCTDSPLFDVDNVVVTPHLGASTEEAQINVAIDVIKQMIDFFDNNIIKNAVNVASVDPNLLSKLEPFIRLSEKLGKLSSQLVNGGIIEAEIQYGGEISETNVNPLTISFLKGLLELVEEEVNYINAPFIAKDRGIKVKETKTSTVSDFTNLITVKIKTDKNESILIQGTLFHHDDIRIIRINDFDIDVVPKGYVLLCMNKDIPGVVGQVGTMLGQSGINIAGMQVGRKTSGGEALIITNIDQPISNDVLEQIRKSKNIISAKILQL
jgi:D-3-phosphoglycerate dehydrogenase / 2-oxoglutarate reductase